MNFFLAGRHELVIEAVMPINGRVKRLRVYRPLDGSGELIMETEPVAQDTPWGIATMAIDEKEYEYMMEGMAESTIERQRAPLDGKVMAQQILDERERLQRRASGLVVFAT